ncbi:MAG: hypothetical protein ACD_12C00356G0003, partial [uncultured bacterium]
MLLKKIKITNFRNFDNKIFSFNSFLTIITGKNSVGKTSLMEAIYFSFKGCGFRNEKDEELIQFDKSTVSVETELADDQETVLYKVNMQKGQSLVKTCFINKVKKRFYDYNNQTIPLAIFSPSFIYVIDGQMGERRNFFDGILSTIDKQYKNNLSDYERTLRKRNKIIEMAKNMSLLKEQLLFWDDHLIKQADYITSKRQKFINFLNNQGEFDYRHFNIKYLKNEISKKTLEATFEKQ